MSTNNHTSLTSASTAAKDTNVIQSKTKVQLERRHQLIDLNKEYINFEIVFECRSLDATREFEILVINQEQLNTIDLTNLEMKKAKGFISGNIVADEDRYQNYFLVLRSVTEDPHDIDLEITIKPIPPNPEKVNPVEVPVSPAEAAGVVASKEKEGGLKTKVVSFFRQHKKEILIGVLIVVVIMGYLWYQHHLRSKKGGSEEKGDKDMDLNSVHGSEKSAKSEKEVMGDDADSIVSNRDGGIGDKLSEILKRKQQNNKTVELT